MRAEAVNQAARRRPKWLASGLVRGDHRFCSAEQKVPQDIGRALAVPRTRYMAAQL